MIYTLLRREPAALERLLAILTCAFLVGLMAQVKVYLPGNPVPVTMQVFAVLLTGLLLRPADAFAAMVGYLALIAAGLPLNAGDVTGLAALRGATAGYLIAFPAAAWLVATIAGAERHLGRSLAGALAGVALIYALGAGWLGLTLNSASKAWEFGVAPFIVVDVAKAILAVAAGEGLVRSLFRLGPR